MARSARPSSRSSHALPACATSAMIHCGVEAQTIAQGTPAISSSSHAQRVARTVRAHAANPSALGQTCSSYGSSPSAWPRYRQWRVSPRKATTMAVLITCRARPVGCRVSPLETHGTRAVHADCSSLKAATMASRASRHATPASPHLPHSFRVLRPEIRKGDDRVLVCEREQVLVAGDADAPAWAGRGAVRSGRSRTAALRRSHAAPPPGSCRARRQDKAPQRA